MPPKIEPAGTKVSSNMSVSTTSPRKIWLIQHGEPLPTSTESVPFRTARLSKELAARGHSVRYWCSSLFHHTKTLYCDKTTVFDIHGYKLHVLHAGKYTSNHSFLRYFHHKKMAQLFAQEARKLEKPDVIVAGLPIHYCAYEAVKYGKEMGIPVVVDIRDYWPDVFLMLFPKRLRWLGRIILSREFTIARSAMKGATTLVSMMSHLLDWGVQEYAERERKADDKVFFIGGDEDKGKLSFQEYFPELNERLNGRFVVNYCGSFSSLNHPMILIEAAKYLRKKGEGDNFLFLLAGIGDYLKKCQVSAQELDNIVFPGWLNADQLVALNSVSSVGVISSYLPVMFPNKTFSYFSAGLPVLSSVGGDLYKLFCEYNAGFYFDITNPNQLAEKLIELKSMSPNSYKELRDNAKKLFLERLKADKIYKEYADYVEQVAERYPERITHH